MACPACDPRLAPTGPRKGEHHFGVRFGDWWLEVYVLDSPQVRVHSVYEIEVGALRAANLSRAWVYDEPYGRCPCGQGTSAHITYARWGVRSAPCAARQPV